MMEGSSENDDEVAAEPQTTTVVEDSPENIDNTTSIKPSIISEECSEKVEESAVDATLEQEIAVDKISTDPAMIPVVADDVVEKDEGTVPFEASPVSDDSAYNSDKGGTTETVPLPDDNTVQSPELSPGEMQMEEGVRQSKATSMASSEHALSAEDDIVDKSSSRVNFRRKMFCLSISITVVLALIVGLVVYFVSKPKNIETKQATNVESPYSLVTVGNFEEFDGFVRIDSTFRVDNPDQITYYLTLQVKKEDIPETNDNVSLLLMESTDATLQNTVARSYAIPDILSRTFPFRLHAFFDPSVFQTALLVDDIESKMAMVIGTASLSGQIDSNEDTTKDRDREKKGESKISDTFGTSMEKPPALLAKLQGWQDYDVRGTLKIDYALEIADGSTVWRPFLLFEGVQPPDSPGPYLYLTQRENQRPGQVLDGDIFVPIDSAENSSFTLTGSFAQALDELTAEDIENYVNGSFVVWCRPFKAYLGGGQITVQES